MFLIDRLYPPTGVRKKYSFNENNILFSSPKQENENENEEEDEYKDYYYYGDDENNENLSDYWLTFQCFDGEYLL